MRENKTSAKTKYLILIFGAFAIFFTGYPHIWSIYQPYAMELTGWSQSQASLGFYLSFLAFVPGNIIGGRIQDRSTPGIVVAVGGGIFAAGILLSAFSMRQSPVMLYLTYGIMQGFGQGMIYTTIISTAQKWFPDRTGFASGVIVTANGLCGFFLAPLSRVLLAERGIQFTLLTIGSVLALAWILASIFIRNPEKRDLGSGGGKESAAALYEGRQYSSGEMLRTKKFYYLLAVMLFGLIPYLILSPLSQTVQMDRGIASGIAVTSVMAGSVCNAAARLLLPTAADKVGRTICLKGVLAFIVLAMVLLITAPAPMTTVCVVLMYACYGGIMGSFPSLASSIFGMKHSGENYGYVMFGIIVATLSAPAVTNSVLGAGMDINVVFAIGALCGAAALGFLLLLERELKKETAVQIQPEIE
ncbi:MAG: MFS transporter [Blautia sp.]|jgi:OFA family oxalate/formate antiporter-like MFS transporter|uniref:MFS transporter n=1 Tax=Blautia sp. TaxID=1955243 RepID=UPI003D8BBC5C